LYLYGRAGPLNFVDPNGLQDVPAGSKEITRWSTHKEAAANDLIAQNRQITASAAGAAVAGTAAGFAKPTDNRSIGERVARGWFASQHGSSPEKLVTDAFRDPTDPDVIKERATGAALRHPVVGTLVGSGSRFLRTVENIQAATDETLEEGARAEAASNVAGTGVGLLADALSAVVGGRGGGGGSGGPPGGGGGGGSGGAGIKLSQVRALRDFGLDKAARRAFFGGEAVVFEAKTAAKPTAVLQKQPDTLSAGILQIKAPGAGAQAFSQFRGAATGVAKSLGLPKLELMGIAIINPELAATLSRAGFTPATRDVPSALGGGKVEVLTRTFPVRR
jgi:hypothetical protein